MSQRAGEVRGAPLAGESPRALSQVFSRAAREPAPLVEALLGARKSEGWAAGPMALQLPTAASPTQLQGDI
ncbi:MAG TPA: hypothetical protein VIK01_17135 [Polyangiaceae bacterium]